MTVQQRKLFQGLFLINFLISLGFGISDAFFSLYCQSIGARGVQLGAVMGGYALSKIIFSPFMGLFVDKLGQRSVMILSLLLYLVVSSFYLVTDNLELILLLRLLQGTGCAMFRPVMQALVADHAPLDTRGKVMGTFDISFYAALTLGPLLGGIIVDWLHFRGLFSGLVLCSLMALGLAYNIVPSQVASEDHNKKIETSATYWEKTFLGSTFLGLSVFIFGRACGITVCATFLPILLSSKLGLSGAQIGVVMASTTLIMTLLLRPVGKITDRVSHKLLIFCGGMTVPLLYMLLPLVANFTQVLGVSLGIGAFSALSQPAVTSLLAEEGRQFGMGITMGRFNAFLNLGFVIGPLVGSLLQSIIGINAVFITIGVLGLASAVGFALATVRGHSQYEIAG